MLQHLAARRSRRSRELDRDDRSRDTVAVLRGEIFFAGAEEVLTRLAPLVGDDGCLVLDFSNVTRVGGAARTLFLRVPEVAGSRPTDARASRSAIPRACFAAATDPCPPLGGAPGDGGGWRSAQRSSNPGDTLQL